MSRAEAGDLTGPGRRAEIALEGAVPRVSRLAWVAPGAVVVGDVELADDCGVWYGAVLRGDGDAIVVGARSNIQDASVLHADPGYPVTVGAGVTVGHCVVLHGCSVGDDALVGMGAVVMNGASVGRGSLVAAGALVTEGTHVPAGVLVAGSPARVRRELTEEERAGIRHNADVYRDLLRRHRDA